VTPTEFRHIRHALGLSAEGLARLLQVSSGRTVRRWEAGNRNIPGPVRALMLLLNSGIITPTNLIN
jgi:DNA-binding transcriptional regulator YiaG